ncbi:cyclin-U4-1-like [Malania oleifera]|uniref:cyclin-U4-1-like n=1 Tax=Malania oleifera TaxID=397392 RepID=UPI0025AE4F50|nr:cyclin-U4-1-like [Malania oleifera]
MADAEAAEMTSADQPPKVITFLSRLLQRVAESNDLRRGIHRGPERISAFHGLSRPTISIQSYLERIFKYANCSPSCFVVAYVYLDRFVQRHPSLPITSFNVHRLLITSVLLSAKFMDDMYYNNAYYAKVGGISTGEMNLLEVDFLFGISFQLNVTPTTFYTYCSFLQTQMLLLTSSSPPPPPPPPHEHHLPLKPQQYCCFSDQDNNHHDDHQSQLTV